MKKVGIAILILVLSVILAMTFLVLTGKAKIHSKLNDKTNFAESPFAQRFYNPGKLTVITFWATWCGGCIEEFPALVKIKKDYGNRINFGAFSMDDEQDKLIRYLANHPEFKAVDVTQENWDYRSVITHKMGLINEDEHSFGISNTSFTIPYTILLKDHKILYKATGTFDPKILRKMIDKNK